MAKIDLTAPSTWLDERTKVNLMMTEIYGLLNALLADQHNHTNKNILDAITAAFTTADKATLLSAAQTDANGKLVESALPNSVLSGLKWQGTWNVTTNTPAIPVASQANSGFFYKVAVAGTSSITGSSVAFTVGDWLIGNGTVWQRVASTESVVSVNGQTGAVTLNATNVGAVALTNFGAGSKGSLVSGAGPAGVTAVTALGTNGQILVADSSTTGGIKWVTPDTSAATLAPHDPTKAYSAGELVLNGALPVKANGTIPANTNLTWGTTGATWSPVLSIGVWRGLFAVSTAYAVDDIVVHSQNRWAPLCRVSTAFTSEATGTLIQQTRTSGAAHNGKIAALLSGQSADNWAEYMFTPATATASGSVGGVPAPAAGEQNHVLTGGGWKKGINDQSASRYIDIGDVRIQWGWVAGTTATMRTIPLPASFGNLAYTVTANGDNGTGALNPVSRVVVIGGKTATQFDAQVITAADNGSTMGFSWQAIGIKP